MCICTYVNIYMGKGENYNTTYFYTQMILHYLELVHKNTEGNVPLYQYFNCQMNVQIYQIG